MKIVWYTNSVLSYVQLVKNEAHLWTLFNCFLNDIKRFETVVIPWKIAYFDQKIDTFLGYKPWPFHVIPNDCRGQPCVFNKWIPFCRPSLDFPTKRFVWIRHRYHEIHKTNKKHRALGVVRVNTFFYHIIKNTFSNCHQTSKQIAMGAVNCYSFL